MDKGFGMDQAFVASPEDDTSASGSSWGPAAIKHTSVREWRMCFLLMSLTFGVNHATVTVPIGYASSVLSHELGNYANAALYTATMVSAMFVAPLTNNKLGPRNGLILGMSLYAAYVLCFALATASASTSPERWALALGGSLVGGLGAGVLWTCQGSFFAAVVERLADAKQRELHLVTEEVGQLFISRVTADLASAFAFYFLGLECIFRAGFTAVLRYGDVSEPVAFLAYAAIAAAAVLALAASRDLRSATAASQRSHCGKAAEAVQLWSDPKVWCLGFSNFAFGLTVAYINGHVNGRVLGRVSWSSDFIGFLGAMITFVATLISHACGWLGKRHGNMPLATLAPFFFLAAGALSQTDLQDGWAWALVVIYVLMGMGRGMYESTNKGLVAELFQGPQVAGAFANSLLQTTAATTLGFYLNAAGRSQILLYLLFGCAALSAPGLGLAALSHRRARAQAQQPAALAAGGTA